MTFKHLGTIKKIEILDWISHNKANTGKDKMFEVLGTEQG